MPTESSGGVADTGSDTTSDLSDSSSTSSSTTGMESDGGEDEDDSAADTSPPADLPSTVPYSAVQEIFDRDCVDGCHEQGGTYESLDLEGYARNELILVASAGSSLFHVVVGDSESSYLYHKCNGSQGMVGGMGGTMPRGAPRLEQEDIDTIRDWIDGGALP